MWGLSIAKEPAVAHSPWLAVEQCLTQHLSELAESQHTTPIPNLRVKGAGTGGNKRLGSYYPEKLPNEKLSEKGKTN